MAIFSKKTEEKEVGAMAIVAENKPVKKLKSKKVDKKESKEDKKDAVKPDGVIIAPRVAEKSALLSDKGIYTFEVEKNATKGKVFRAVKNKYKVVPVKINIVNLPDKKVFVRGKWGRKSGIKKAIVFLKKGDKIEFI